MAILEILFQIILLRSESSFMYDTPRSMQMSIIAILEILSLWTDPLCTALCGGDGNRPLTSDQLELLKLLSEASSPDVGGDPVLRGGWKGEGHGDGGRGHWEAGDDTRLVRDHLSAMTFGMVMVTGLSL